MIGDNNIFGAKIAEESWDTAKLETTTAKLHVPWVRLSKNLYIWTGLDPRFDYFKAKGYKIVSNLNYATTPLPTPFPTGTGLTNYINRLDSYLNKFKVNLVTVENEEDNLTYHTGGTAPYIAQLQAAADLCLARGVRVTNGGLIFRNVTYSVTRSLVARGMTTEANAFAETAMPRWSRAAALKSGISPTVDAAVIAVDTFLAAYATMTSLTYINIHLYEPLVLPFTGVEDETIVTATAGAFQTIAEDIRYRTGNTKQLVCTEMGTINNSPALVTDVLQKSLDAGFRLVYWYSGDYEGIGGPVALHNGDGTLRPLGEAFAQFMITKYGT